MVPIFVMLGRFVRAVVGAWRSDESFRIPLALVVTVVLGDPGTPPAPTASELLDATLRAVAGIVLLLLVVAAVLAVVFLILWLLSEIRLEGLGSVLMANRLRTAWIGLGVLFFVVVVVPGALLVYQYSGIGDWQKANQQQDVGPESVICNKEYHSQAGGCIAPRNGYASVVCEAESRADVSWGTPCRDPS